VALSFGMTIGFLAICMALVWWIFKTGYRMKN
jgi:ABC-2 type transport system permease protein